jgi:hypothetical protein
VQARRSSSDSRLEGQDTSALTQPGALEQHGVIRLDMT